MLISSENVSFGFNGGSLLENVAFTLSEGERVGLIGANGEGKTTLIRL
ncbi:MAG: ATP-binding cassette domain-containing protein, partial [Clostridia bacterium]|nr:ATP-binding cassette domain-containing protein [Clostridia bacterium]